MELISVAVPVYNVGAYVERCVRSIINQTYSRLEIILTDDGSTDESPRICDELAARDFRVKVIHKANGGLSSARNAAIAASSGKYICFIDSDDVISPDFIRSLYDAAVSHDCDIAQCGLTEFTDGGPSFADTADYTVISGRDAALALTHGCYAKYVVACNKLYRRSLLDDTTFPDGLLHEDEGTTYRLLYTAKSVAVTDAALYGYFRRPDSITGAGFSEKSLDYLTQAKARYLYFENRDRELYYMFMKVYCVALASYYTKSRGAASRKSRRAMMREYRTLYPRLMKSGVMSAKLIAVLTVLYALPSVCPLMYKISDKKADN